MKICHFKCVLVLLLIAYGCNTQRSRRPAETAGDGDSDGDCGAVRSPDEFAPSPIVNGSETWDPAVVDLNESQALAVGALLTNRGGGWSTACTATLVAPNLVLTAAHCVTNFWNSQTSEPNSVRFAVGEDSASPVHTFLVREVARHPSYRSSWRSDASHDVAILVLDQTASSVLPDIEPIPLNCSPLERENFIGQDVQNVGYGLTQPMTSWRPPPENTLRYWTVEEAVELTNYDFIVDGHGESAVCNGDSGGPSLWTMQDGVIRVIGTVSWGDPSCVDRDHFARTDDSCDFFSQYFEGCGEVTTQGYCEENTAIFCESESVMEVNCSASGRICGEDDFGRMRCLANTDPCAGETFEGRCAGDVAFWCEDNTAYELDCAAEGRWCGHNREGLFRCLDEDPCAGLTWVGICDGTVARWCDDGEIRERRCADCGQTCEFVDEVGGYYCL